MHEYNLLGLSSNSEQKCIAKFHFVNSICNASFFEIIAHKLKSISIKKRKKQINFNLNMEPHKSGLPFHETA